MQLSSGKNSGPLLVTALVTALLFAVYYYVVLPKQNEAEMKQSAVDSLNSEISTMKEQIALIEEEKKGAGSGEFAIRKKLPESREIDQLLLSLEEIEYISDTRIVGVSFNNYDDLVSASGLVDPTTATEENQTDNVAEATPTDDTTAESANQQEEVLPVSAMSTEALPENLKLITFQVDIESPDDEQLQQFLKEIEGLERVMHIDTIEYLLPGEEDALLDDAPKVVSASIQVTTFYFE